VRYSRVLSLLVITIALVITGCSSAPKHSAKSAAEVPPTPAASTSPPAAAIDEPREATTASPSSKGGGYYLDDGPGDNPPADFDEIPDATPRKEPLHKYANRTYTVMGKTYTPTAKLETYKAVGLASWYGKRFHGQKTASGEIYDMYGMTAAHPTLPIPSYVRVTQLKNNKSVIVRINDRGPFRRDRLIDLSYSAAYKLGIIQSGSGLVQVETIIPGTEVETMIASAPTKVAEEPAPPEIGDKIAQATTQPETATPQTELVAAAKSYDESSAIYLQLGAFKLKENADSYLAKLRSELVNLANTMELFMSGGLFRIHIGPFSSHDEAKRAATNIARKINITPLTSTR
jgi:rare lipoprotein A